MLQVIHASFARVRQVRRQPAKVPRRRMRAYLRWKYIWFSAVMCLIIRSLCLAHHSGMDLYCWILALPSLMTTTGQLPTSALSMPNSSLPHHSASPKMCLPLPPVLHGREHWLGIGGPGLLRGVRPQIHDRGVFPRHRAPFALAVALLVLLVEPVRVLEIDLRLVERRIVEIRELEDEALHELLGGLVDHLLIEVGRAGDDLALEALLERLLGQRCT